MQYRTVEGVLAEEVGGRTLLIDAASNELITLNPVGSLVWAALQRGSASLDDLVGAVVAACPDAPADLVRDDVRVFIDELIDAGLLSRV